MRTNLADHDPDRLWSFRIHSPKSSRRTTNSSTSAIWRSGPSHRQAEVRARGHLAALITAPRRAVRRQAVTFGHVSLERPVTIAEMRNLLLFPGA